MRVLIDECLPKQLKGWLAGKHEAVTVQEMGWANVKNGKLLSLANGAGFELFVTADKNIYYQQKFCRAANLGGGHSQQPEAAGTEKRSRLPAIT